MYTAPPVSRWGAGQRDSSSKKRPTMAAHKRSNSYIAGTRYWDE